MIVRFVGRLQLSPDSVETPEDAFVFRLGSGSGHNLDVLNVDSPSRGILSLLIAQASLPQHNGAQAHQQHQTCSSGDPGKDDGAGGGVIKIINLS